MSLVKFYINSYQLYTGGGWGLSQVRGRAEQFLCYINHAPRLHAYPVGAPHTAWPWPQDRKSEISI